MEFSSDDIGAKLMETITVGLYGNNLNCLREYVQNGVDVRAKNIEIYFENGNHNLIIKDDGSGMSEEELDNSLNIGKSDKSRKNIGWRGIGIWSGVPVCQRIVIITKKKSDKIYRTTIDCVKLQKEYLTNETLTKVLSDVTGKIEKMDLGKGDSIENDHYTIIRLESILPAQKTIFDENDISAYLQRTMPVPFDETKFKFAAKINEWLKGNYVELPEVNITFHGYDKIKNKKIFRPPTCDDIFMNDVSDVSPKEFKIGDKLIAVGWSLTHNKNSKLTGVNSGIYFKNKGFTVGDDNLVFRQHKGTYNQRQYGEIHIISDEIKEDASRNNFEHSNELVQLFLDEVGKYIGMLDVFCHDQTNSNPTAPIKRAEKYIEKGDLEAAKKDLETAKKNLSKSKNTAPDPSLEGTKNQLNMISGQRRKEIEELEAKIAKSNVGDTEEKKKEPLIKTIIENLSPAVKTAVSNIRNTDNFESNLTNCIRDILREKTDLNDNEIYRLSKVAYGWNDISEGTTIPKLVIDPVKDNPKANNKFHKRSNLFFGAMIYAVHDLFVNQSKHGVGSESFKWFENSTDDEKKIIKAEVIATVDLIYRMIKKSEKYQP